MRGQRPKPGLEINTSALLAFKHGKNPMNRHVIRVERIGDHERSLHATKGWRWRRVEGRA